MPASMGIDAVSLQAEKYHLAYCGGTTLWFSSSGRRNACGVQQCQCVARRTGMSKTCPAAGAHAPCLPGLGCSALFHSLGTQQQHQNKGLTLKATIRSRGPAKFSTTRHSMGNCVRMCGSGNTCRIHDDQTIGSPVPNPSV